MTGGSRKNSIALLGTALVLPLVLAASGDGSRMRPAAAGRPLAIRHVCAVPMDAEQVLCGRTIVIEGDRISAVGPDDSTPIPAEADSIDGRGLWALPGLID